MSLENGHKEFDLVSCDQLKSRNLHLDGLLLSKACKFSDEKVQKSYISCHWRVIQSLTKNWQLVPNMTWGIWWISTQAVKSLKICTLMCYFCWKYITFEPRKYRGVMCHKTAEWCKIYFVKWHEEFVEFWLNAWKSQHVYFNRLLLTKAYNVWAKTVQTNYVSLNWRSMQVLKEKWLVFS